MTNRSKTTQAIIWLEAVAAQAKAEAGKLRAVLDADARDELAKGTAPTWRIPDIATITLPVSQEAVYVANADVFAEWVSRRYPSETRTVPVVRLAWQKGFLDSVKVSDGQAISDDGEVVPGLAVRPGGMPGWLSIRPAAAVREVFGHLAAESLKRLALEAGPAVPVVLAELERGDG